MGDAQKEIKRASTINDAKLAQQMQPVEYNIAFAGPKFGFEIVTGIDGFGAQVGQLFSKFSKLNIVPKSLITEVQEESVEKKTLEEVREMMLEAMSKHKGCEIKFTTTLRELNLFQTRSNLKILVLGAEALYKPAEYCTIDVLGASLGTDRIEKNKNPSWNNMLVWYKYGVRAETNAV